jgi:hypothetical protein
MIKLQQWPTLKSNRFATWRPKKDDTLKMLRIPSDEQDERCGSWTRLSQKKILTFFHLSLDTIRDSHFTAGGIETHERCDYD